MLRRFSEIHQFGRGTRHWNFVREMLETKQQLMLVMGLLRATIQHQRRVRLLISGNATFEELSAVEWHVDQCLRIAVLREINCATHSGCDSATDVATACSRGWNPRKALKTNAVSLGEATADSNCEIAVAPSGALSCELGSMTPR